MTSRRPAHSLSHDVDSDLAEGCRVREEIANRNTLKTYNSWWAAAKNISQRLGHSFLGIKQRRLSEGTFLDVWS